MLKKISLFTITLFLSIIFILSPSLGTVRADSSDDWTTFYTDSNLSIYKSRTTNPDVDLSFLTIGSNIDNGFYFYWKSYGPYGETDYVKFSSSFDNIVHTFSIYTYAGDGEQVRLLYDNVELNILYGQGALTYYKVVFNNLLGSTVTDIKQSSHILFYQTSFIYSLFDILTNGFNFIYEKLTNCFIYVADNLFLQYGQLSNYGVFIICFTGIDIAIFILKFIFNLFFRRRNKFDE